MPGTFVVVAITREEARVWKTGVKPGTQPEKIYAPSEDIHKHMRIGQHHKGHDTDHDSQKFYESIAKAVSDAGEILIIGHGKGKASASLKLIQAWERRHADLAKKVVDAMDSDLQSLTEPQILALAREWIEHHRYF
ncbi:MAG: hypothetical protein RL448_21 [Actinomycetota bacterium]|jgi:hypothetical protein